MKSLDLIKILKEEGVGILPTDTIYGIVGLAQSKKVVERIYKIKGRDDNKPLIILISTIVHMEKFGISDKIINTNKRILNKVWPHSASKASRGKTGAVSVVLPCLQKRFEYLHRGTNSLAFRLPRNKKLIEIIKKTGPLVAPSANLQGLKPVKTINEAKKYFGNKVDFYQSGKTNSKPSTIISLLNKEPKIIRQGKTKVTF